MKTLNRLCIAVALTFTIASYSFAGATNSPPCAPPEPGTVNSPPCADAQIAQEDSTPQTITLASSNVIDEYVVSEVAIGLVQNLLSIY
jgi:hypothetical protein